MINTNRLPRTMQERTKIQRISKKSFKATTAIILGWFQYFLEFHHYILISDLLKQYWVSSTFIAKEKYMYICLTTVWCNQMWIVFTEMSSCRALTRHFGIKIAFLTKNMKIEFFGIFIMKILTLWVIKEHAY